MFIDFRDNLTIGPNGRERYFFLLQMSSVKLTTFESNNKPRFKVGVSDVGKQENAIALSFQGFNLKMFN